MCDTIARADNFLPTLRSVSSGAFIGTPLKYMELPEEVHTMSNQRNVVYQNLEYLALPDSITSITWNITNTHTSNLITLYWGKGAKSIDEMLQFPSTLRHIYVPQSTPPTLSGYHYSGGINEIKDQCTLYVPIGASAAYRADSEWGMFTNIVEVEF